MNNRVRMLKRMRELCEDVGPDDGIDPREMRRRRSRRGRKKDNRKLLQLCGQVARAVNLGLGGSGDDVLSQLVVVEVTPHPDASRLRVVVTGHENGSAEPDVVLARLRRAAGWLRTEVADAIHRKRVPELIFDWRTP